MEFRTCIGNIDCKRKIHHSDAIFLIGSCFSDNIGSKLKKSLFLTEINPFGTVYNPISILHQLDAIISKKHITEADLIEHNGLWHHFLFHSRYSSRDKNTALDRMNEQIHRAHLALKDCRIAVITLGTAFVYESRHTHRVVSNCHKIPAKEFDRYMLRYDAVRDALRAIVERISSFAPEARVMFTVSPIRHIGDGLVANQLSKSTLRTAVGEITNEMPSICSYFPAYEIMMDELRDYRFYAADMLHPSEVAVEYIWNAFKATFFDDSTAQLALRCERLHKRLEHRMLTDNTSEIERFRAETQKITRALVDEFPYIKNTLRQYNSVIEL